jgi:nucleoside-diphosphate-sugar epimerase
MKVFITGASGFVGPAIVSELISNGHEIVALVRSDKSQAKLEALGVKEFARGDLTDLDLLTEYAKKCDGAIQMAFGFDDFIKSCEEEKNAIISICDAFKGTNKPFIITGGTLVCSIAIGEEMKNEDSSVHLPPPISLRLANEELALSYKDQGVRSMGIRLSPTTHDKDDLKGFMAIYGGLSKSLGFAGYIDQGENEWTAVHRLDAARLYRLALEKGEPGTTFHAVGEIVKWKDIARVVGSKLGLETKSLPKAEANQVMGFFGGFVGIHAPTAASLTKQRLGWEPKEISLFEDINENYF